MRGGGEGVCDATAGNISFLHLRLPGVLLFLPSVCLCLHDHRREWQARPGSSDTCHTSDHFLHPRPFLGTEENPSALLSMCFLLHACPGATLALRKCLDLSCFPSKGGQSSPLSALMHSLVQRLLLCFTAGRDPRPCRAAGHGAPVCAACTGCKREIKLQNVLLVALKFCWRWTSLSPRWEPPLHQCYSSLGWN